MNGQRDPTDPHVAAWLGDRPEGDRGDDAFLALSLITIWATRTGRTLRAVPIGELTADELEDFWADDQLWPAPVFQGPRE
ncbi:hypothetical protein AGRA3207_002745 [Actinomadura graeca]|uniref:Uncharacterized protein n=1 Tax=Actinomadura graeca TaxID=2750812 RepID=A0ABX8QUF6_9ACTN|nr:hypothetical protein [Actinomadura graeca]QXJ21844.1 hypothetical protein AGRA3207_002745 [Actinomadura graeca]